MQAEAAWEQAALDSLPCILIEECMGFLNAIKRGWIEVGAGEERRGEEKEREKERKGRIFPSNY